MDGSHKTMARRAVLTALGPNADCHTVEQLLDLFVLRGNKDSPLHLALLMRKLEAWRKLLAEGAHPNILSQGKSPMYVAAETGQDDALRMLFDAGARKHNTRTHTENCDLFLHFSRTALSLCGP